MACTQQSFQDYFLGLDSEMNNLSLSRPAPLSAVTPTIVNPLDNNMNIAQESAPIKYHKELGISQIYWNI